MDIAKLDKRYKDDAIFHELVKRFSWTVRNSALTYADFRDAANFAESTDRFIAATKNKMLQPESRELAAGDELIIESGQIRILERDNQRPA